MTRGLLAVAKAIVAGLVAEFATEFILGLLTVGTAGLTFFLFPFPPVGGQELAEAGRRWASSTGLRWANGLSLVASGVVGGYVAAWLAERRPISIAFIVGAMSSLRIVPSALRGFAEAYVVEFLSLLLVTPAAIVGGSLRTLLRDRGSDQQSDWA
jgi:hypothetical protein